MNLYKQIELSNICAVSLKRLVSVLNFLCERGLALHTADERLIDQRTLIFRYIKHNTSVERFVKFLPNQGHKAEETFQKLTKFLADHGIDTQNCQSVIR